jgi:hypothetical protein
VRYPNLHTTHQQRNATIANSTKLNDLQSTTNSAHKKAQNPANANTYTHTLQVISVDQSVPCVDQLQSSSSSNSLQHHTLALVRQGVQDQCTLHNTPSSLILSHAGMLIVWHRPASVLLEGTVAHTHIQTQARHRNKLAMRTTASNTSTKAWQAAGIRCIWSTKCKRVHML